MDSEILQRVSKEDLTEKVTLDLRPEGSRGATM